MPMVRRRSTRVGARKLLTRGAANRSFSKKKLQWVVPFNTPCGVVCQDPGSLCPNGGSIQLVATIGPNSLITEFEDAMTIVKIEGDLWFQPQVTSTGETCVAIAVDLGSRRTLFRMGLKKEQIGQRSSGVPVAFNPLDSGVTESDLSDYADGKWAHLWPAHTFLSTSKIGYRQPDPSCCSTQPSYVVPPTASGAQPTYTVPAISCIGCPIDENQLPCTAEYTLPNPHHVKLNVRRRLKMTGNDHLSLFFGWEDMKLCADTQRKPQAKMDFWGQIRMLIEK